MNAPPQPNYSPPKAFYRILIIALLLPACYGCNWVKREGKIKAINTFPFPIDVTIYTPHGTDEGKADGWHTLQPGDSIVRYETFTWVKPRFYIVARSNEKASEMLRWHYGLPISESGIKYFEGDTAFQLPAGGGYFSEDYDEEGNVNERNQGNAYSSYFYKEYENFYFEKVETDGSWFDYEATHIFTDTDFPEIYEGTETSTDPILEQARRARGKYFALLTEFHKEGKFIVRNTAPYGIYFAYNIDYSIDSSRTEGWFKLEAGEERLITKTFRGITPNISVFAHSAPEDAGLLRYLYALPDEHPAIRYFQVGADDQYIYKSIRDGFGFLFNSLHQEEEVYGSNTYPVQFTKIIGQKQDNSTESYAATYTIADPDFESIYVDNGYSDSDKASRIYAQKAEILGASLQRNFKFDSAIKNFNTDCPIHLGIGVEDHNGLINLGITVTNNRYETNLLGQKQPFEPGDIITSINDTPVFGIRDLSFELLRHHYDVDGGIAKPISFTLVRGGYEYSGKAQYFFNPTYKNWPKNQEFRAGLAGFFDALTLGFDEDLVRAFSGDKRKAWNYVQNKIWLQQFYPNSFRIGSGIGLFTSPGRLIFEKALARRVARAGISKTTSTLIAGASLEMSEEIIWTIGNRNPMLTEGEFNQEVRNNALIGAGFGLAFGSFDLLRKY